MRASEELVVLLATLAAIVILLTIGYKAGEAEARQRQPIACEPKCQFTYRNGKLLNVVCPDSLGRMP